MSEVDLARGKVKANRFTRLGRRAAAGGSACRHIALVTIAGVLLIAPSGAAATALPSTIEEDTTLTLAGSPYTGGTTVASGVTLKIEPGVELKAPSIIVDGTLKAEGTAEEPVVFDEKENGGIKFEPGSGASVLDHVEINKLGSSWYTQAAIKITESSPTITNSVFRDCGLWAIWVPEGGSPEIADNEFFNTERSAVYFSAGSGDTGEVNIHGNYVEGGYTDSAISVNVTGSSVTGKSLSGNAVVKNNAIYAAALSYAGPDIPTDVTGNFLTENKSNYIEVRGTQAHSSTWVDGGVPIRLGGTTVASGVTLKIEPGVELKAPSIIVDGTLKAEGTAEEPVVFDEKENGGIKFEPGSGASVLDHVEINKLGSSWYTQAAIKITESSPTITNSVFRDCGLWAIWVPEGGSPEIADNEFFNTERSAVYFSAGSGDTGEVNIHGNYVEGGYTDSAISVNVTGSSVTGKSLSGNAVVKNNAIYAAALSYAGPDIPTDVTGNFLTENKSNYIEVRGTQAHSSTWVDGGVPIRLGGTTVASGVTLKIEPGVELKAPSIIVDGTLKAEGTAEEPVVFDEKENGGIKFEPGSGASVLDHVEINKLGSSWYTQAAIKITESSPTITNSVFRDCGLWAIWVPEGGSPEIADNEFFNTERSAVYFSAGSGDTGEVNIHGNYVEGGYTDSAISVNVTGSSVTGKSLSGNAVVKNNAIYAAALSYAGPDIPTDVTGNFLTENKSNYIEVRGTQAHSSTWVDGGVPIRLGGTTVASGVTLKIEPGVELKAPSMTVEGTLRAEGTQEEPVIWNGNEGGGQITFLSGSGASALDHSEFEKLGSGYYGAPAVRITESSPTLTNSTFRESPAYAIGVSSTASPKIEWNRFRGNQGGVSYEGEGKLSVPRNDWGCASGPKPAGCGDEVGANIDWKPAVQLPELNAQCRGKESQCGEGADPVSLATGHLSYSHRDLFLTNKGDMPLEFSRAYSSGSSSDTGLGHGWSQTGLASATELESGAVLILRQDGRQDVFYKTGESGYKAPSGVSDRLAKVEGTFRLTTLEGATYAFDASGRIATITNDHGLVTTYDYDENGRLATITDPSAQTLTFSYNGSNHITLVKDSTGREVKFAYTEAGDLETVTDALGGVTEYEYDAQHRIKAITDPRENVILKNTYDGQGRIVEQRDGLNNLWKLEYKPSETIVTEPEGGKVTYGFDGQDRVVSEENQLGNVTTTSYDATGNVDEVLRPGGAKWEFSYDPAGNLTSVLDPEGGERSYEYDGQNHLTEFTDERGKVWEYEWSEENDLEKATDPEAGETTFEYDPAGQPVKVVDANEGESEFSYDARGNLESASDALEHETAFEYDARNHLIKRTAPGLAPEEFERNAYGDMLSRTTPEGRKTEYAYDPNGVLEEVIDPAEEAWTIKNNAMERPTEYVDPLEQATEIEYDGNLNPIAVTDRRGKETTYAYDLANQLEEVVRPEGGDWEFDYDARGNRIEAIEPRENATTYEYDLLDRMTEAAEPLTATTSYEYDPTGNLTSFTDPRENTTDLVYDELGRLTELKQPLGKVTSFGYDGVGNRISRTAAEGTVDFDYDAANRLEEIRGGETTLRAYEYDAANRIIGAIDAQADEIEIGHDEDGRVVSINDGRGQAMTRKYDSRGNVTEQTDGRGTLKYEFDKLSRMIALTDPQSKVFDFEYDPEGDLTKVELPNGVVTTNEFDNAGRLAETTSTKGETTLESLDYEYDPFGNRIGQVDRLSQKTTYDYDPLNRLIDFDPPGEGSTDYDYDPAGNRTEAGATTYSFNALNQLTSASNGTTYDYDDAGRLVEVDPGETSTTYGWSALDELTSADIGAQEIDYAYDAFGRQVLRDDGSTIRPSHYGDLSDRPILDTDAEGNPMMSYVQGPAGLVEQRSGEATSFPLRDAHGDIATLADGEGEVASRQTYDPWGASLSGPTLEMGYLGAQQRRSDLATGLTQMGARPYSPTLGSFISEDPILGYMGVGITFDRYASVGGNPLRYFDLTGRSFIEDAAGAVGDVWGETGGAAWDESAGLRDRAGVAGDGNGGSLSEAPGFVSDRAESFFKSTKDWLSDIDWVPFGDGSCGKTYIASISYADPCASLFEEAGSPDEKIDPPTYIPGVNPPGGVPGFTVPVPSPVRAPVPAPTFLIP